MFGGSGCRGEATRGRMGRIPAVPVDVLAAHRGFQTAQQWHRLKEEFPFEDGSFGCVTCIEVAEPSCLPNTRFFEISRVLVPGGKVLFTTPNNASHRRRMKALKGRAPDDEGYHFRFWVKDQLESKWEEVDMRIELANSYGFLPFVDTFPCYKARTGKKRIYRIGRRYEVLFADRFVGLSAKR
jgi:SAM-dependent methyltransferase